ncbi:MAG: transposase [Patescibacteria group bacterium]|nr:transposase [Patescibacteria group bacterium]
MVRRTWSPKGQTPILLQRGRTYQKVSMIAAVTVAPKRLRTGLYFGLHVDRNIKGPHVVRFLKALVRHLNKPLIIVWDKSRSHGNAKVVKQFQRTYPHVVFYDFPSYAPELNPVEFFWAYLKMNPLANLAFTMIEKLAYAARYHSSKISKQPGIIRSFLYATSLFCRK